MGKQNYLFKGTIITSDQRFTEAYLRTQSNIHGLGSAKQLHHRCFSGFEICLRSAKYFHKALCYV